MGRTILMATTDMGTMVVDLILISNNGGSNSDAGV
jgi:hypothetical protein